MKINIKTIIALIICIVIWGLILICVNANKKEREKKEKDEYIILDTYDYWKYHNFNWQKIDPVIDSDIMNKEINWKKFDVYLNNKFYKTLKYVYKNGEEFFFDDKTKSYEISEERLLLNNGTYFKIINYNQANITKEDDTIINNFIKDYNHSLDELKIKNKYIINSKESIYIVSNYYNSYKESDNIKIFYIAFYRNNNKNYLILNDEGSTLYNDYRLSYIIDIDRNFNNIVISYKCEEVTCNDMYEYYNNNYKKIIATAEEH